MNSWQRDILNDSHTLIAGCSGSGKSVALRSILTQAIRKSPLSVNLILIDLKRVELIDFKDAPHTLAYVDKPEEVAQCLDTVMDTIERRYDKMQANREKMSSDSDIYVVIDEFADLVLTCSKRVVDNIQRISQIGRAARVHLILATQRPTRSDGILKGAIAVNLETRLALRCVCKQDSRNILGINGAEELPRYGYGIFQRKGYNNIVSIDLVQDSEIEWLIDYWKKNYPGLAEQRKIKTAVSKPAVIIKTKTNREEDLLPNAEEWKRLVNTLGNAILRS